MRKEAIGIAINGREVKIAHLVRRDKHRMGVDYLESATLTTDLEIEAKKREAENLETSISKEEVDVFALKNPYETKAPVDKEAGARDNTNVIYSLLRRFATRKIKIGFNISPARVSYQDLEMHSDLDKNVFKGSLKKRIGDWKQGFNASRTVSVITRRDGTSCNVACDTLQPLLVDILEQLNTYFGGNLSLSLMDSNEVALVNLARNSYNFRDYYEINVIVEMEAEFSRIIFMKGDDLLTVSPMITEGISPSINDIIYSKIIYELDNLNIPEISNILLAGKANTFNTKAFFEQKFPDVKVRYIVSQPLAERLATRFSPEDLSEYAIPIALAWKIVDAKNEGFIPTNLLPSQIIDRKGVLKLTLVSYLLLFLIGITAFILTWKITVKKLELGSYEKKNVVLQERIITSEQTVKKVQEIDEQMVKLNKRLALSDSLSHGSDKLLSFLEQLNQSVLTINSVWIEQVQTTNTGFVVKGLAVKRGSVPELSEALGRARIRKLMRTEAGNQRLFAFEMEVDWVQERVQPIFEKPLTPEIFQSAQSGSVEPGIASSSSVPKNTVLASNRSVFSDNYANNSGLKPSSMPGQQSRLNAPPESYAKDRATDGIDREMAAKDFHESDAGDFALNDDDNDLVPARKTEYPENRYRAPGHRPERFLEGSSHFTIRTSAHACKFTAQKEVEHFRSKGYEPYIAAFPHSSSGISYWVCLGDFRTYDEAEQKLFELRDVISRDYDIVGASEDKIDHAAPTGASSPSEPGSIHRKSADNKLIKEATHTVAPARPRNNNETDSYINNRKIDSSTNKAIRRVESEPNIGSDQISTAFTIRISAHATQFTANKEVELYRSKGYEAFITTLPNSSREIPYSVCFGKYMSYNEANEQIQELNQIVPRKYNVVPINE